MNPEKPSFKENEDQNQNKEKWLEVEEEVNKKEREKFERRNKVSVEDFPTIANSPLRNYLENVLENSGGEKEGEPLSEMAEKLTALRWKNVKESLKSYRKNEKNLILYDLALELARKDIINKDQRIIATRNKATDALINRVEGIKKEQEDIKEQSPDAHIALNLLNFREQIKRVKEGTIIETNYVKNKKREIKKAMKRGDHTFLHGHLGGGKTDFAIDISIERMTELNVNREMESWMKENQDAPEKEIINKHKELKDKYKKGIKEGDTNITEKVYPFLISGSKDFNLQDLYTEKSLKVKKFNGSSIQEHVENTNKEFIKWKEGNKERLEKMTDEERKKEEQEASNKIMEMYKMKNTGFGTVVEKIDKELKRAVKEGKPIIIDEANAIPPTLLISMNDLLTKKPGEKAYIPGEGTIEVKEGFNVIMTGNLETSNVAEYFGTEEMNPAFLARLNVQEYDYLPQNKSGNLHEREHPEKDELFQAILCFLSEKNGSMNLPENSLKKIYALAQLAKRTQDVFSGRWKESDMAKTQSGDEATEPRLEKSVLSIRNIINILREWNKGQEQGLDMALWKAFISNATIPEDQNYILNQAKEFNLLRESDGWNIKPEGPGNPLLGIEDIRKYEYEYNRPENYQYSSRDVIELAYGKKERLEFPDVNIEAFDEESEVDFEKIGEFQEFFDELGKYEKAMDVAVEKECSIE